MSLTLTLPIPPSLNNAYQSRRDGRGRFLLPAMKAYKAAVHALVRAAMAESGWAPDPGDRLAVELRMWFADKRRRDLDNCLKIPLDSVAEALGVDDATIDAITIRRAGVDKANPRCEVWVGLEGAR